MKPLGDRAALEICSLCQMPVTEAAIINLVTHKRWMNYSQAVQKLPGAPTVYSLHRVHVCQAPPSLIARAERG
jgi:hypothetical protein